MLASCSQLSERKLRLPLDFTLGVVLFPPPMPLMLSVVASGLNNAGYFGNQSFPDSFR